MNLIWNGICEIKFLSHILTGTIEKHFNGANEETLNWSVSPHKQNKPHIKTTNRIIVIEPW